MKPTRLLPLLLLASLAAFPPPARAQQADPTAPLAPGDALLVRIDNLGGHLPQYREIVDSDGNIELPFLGMLPAAGKTIAAVEAEMAAAYARNHLATNAAVTITYVTRFTPAPARTNLIRNQDPRLPTPPAPPPAPGAGGRPGPRPAGACI